MKAFNTVLAFVILASLAAISPPAISYYYGDTGPMTVEFAAAAKLAAADLSAN